ncbi:glycosyltransferase [Mycobacterium sp. 236(2023)]|uniref:glycosyltransferase n=1 Tax=Mycobacterium sp. 236(2023) TaxID=3038163 RepID=UPI002415290B|nr:glycosyltransferase [Mycobacterium sp. 236(2023)]MDG4664229.1 glycosyltransferase [Mycobacterium sp. 236(2023)]
MTRDDIAIAYDHLTQLGGAERVILALARAFPDAPIYTLLYDADSTYPDFAQHEIRASWLNRVSFLRRSHRIALPFLASVAERTRMDAKVSIASTSGWAHGFQTSGSKIVYCHTPARWLYQADVYLGPGKLSIKKIALSVLGPFLRRWDKRMAATATTYFANSTVVQDRIRRTYGIEAEVLPAPHSIDTSLPQEAVDVTKIPGASRGGFYLCICRLLPYKNVDAVISAFNSLGLPLIVVGAGPEEGRLRPLAGPTVLMMKEIPDEQIRWLYANCLAVVSASYEDYGLTPIEAAAYGKPAIVLRWGGFLDTIREGVTGVYFDRPESPAIVQAVNDARAHKWDSAAIQDHAEGFSEERFIARIVQEIENTDAN